ncbi:MAG: hypothetical protein Nk1A_8290 [Endomicrobiia bacterium]|nr:MAG: hypothetical protein Nk1A_8290 [Endomicrobiia bacterium]
MKSLYNTFRSQNAARDRLIAQAEGDNFAFFESSLEEILDQYTMAEIKSKRYDTILPPITASIACL